MNITLLTNIKYLTATMLMMVCCFAPSMLGAQVDCDVVTVTCNDAVQVSLNSQCELTFEFDMIVENPEDDGTYTVTLADENGDPIYDTNGDVITDNVITEAQVGMTIQVTATLDDCGVSCWGLATVLDKFPPSLICQDVTINCGDDLGTLMPVVTENCAGETLTFEDFDDGIMCDVIEDPAGVFTQYSSILERVWTVTDASGNTSSCTQNIFVNSASIDDVDFPNDFIVDYNIDDDCSVLDLTDVDPSMSGEPTFFSCPSLKFSYADLEFDMCGASTKMLRTWFVIDWCTGEFKEGGQNIEAFDDEGPVVQCGLTCHEIFTENGCTVDFNIPVPVNGMINGIDPVLPSYFDCSDVDFNIFIGLVDEAALGIDVNDMTDPCLEDSNDLPIEYTQVFPNANGEYIFPDATIGLYWFRYEFIDACGNQLLGNDGTPGFCTADVVVRDGTPPNAVCEGNTKVSLSGLTEVQVPATTIDDNSFDQCGEIVLYEIRRLDSPLCDNTDSAYGPYITFCCDDATGADIPVMLRVTDDSGMTDECVGFVCVTAPPPTLLCPANTTATLDCSQPYSDAGFDPLQLVTDCPTTFSQAETFNESGLNVCGVGTVIRTVTVTNSATGALVGSCNFTITVTGDGGLTSGDITCPADVNNIACTANFSPSDLGSEPTINNNSACSDIVTTYVDSEPFIDPDVQACFSITRKWTIIDWCTFDADIPNSGQFICEQQLNFNSVNGPVFTNECDNTIEVLDDDLDCEHPVILTAVAIDQDGCGLTSAIKYTYEVDLFSDGTIDATGATNDATDTYAVGCHIVTFYATDVCGNISSCETEFCVISQKDPTPICRAELVWTIGSDGTAEVWADDFNIKSESACGMDTDLTFSFTADGNTPFITLTCEDLSNGIGETFMFNIYVIDSSGRSEFCEVSLIVQDNLNVCPDLDASNAKVAGRVYDENFIGVQDFEVELADISDNEMVMDVTDEEGDYGFEGIEYYDEYMVAPVRNDLHKEGVSTLDIVLIQRHILNLAPITSPYKLIAADADHSLSITAADLVEIRKLVLDIISEYTYATSWQFIDANQNFIDDSNPWDYKTQVSIPELYIDIANAEFVAVKTGDVNNSVSFLLHGEEAEVRGSKALNITTIDQEFRAGDQVTVTLQANDAYQLFGTQFTVDFDATALTYLDYTPGQLALASDKVNTAYANKGQVAVAADLAYGQELAIGSELTTFYFTAKQDGRLSDVIDINSEMIVAEAYDTDLSVMDVVLNFSGNDADQVTGFVVYQNEPNPFTGSTVVPFYTETAAQVELEIFDAAGKTLYKTETAAAKGNNSFTINSDQIDASGVLYYRVQSGNQSQINKMISIKN